MRRLFTITLLLLLITASGALAQTYPNQPSGFTPIIEHACTTVPTTGAITGVFQGPFEIEGDFALASDGTGPQSPSGVWRTTYPAGQSPGSSPLIVVGWDSGDTEYNRIYYSVWIKFSGPDWESQAVGTKIGFFAQARAPGTAGNDFFFFLEGGTRTSFFLGGRQQNTISRNMDQNVNTNRLVTAGVWHRWETLMEINTVGSANGVFKMWIDGNLTHNYTDVTWRTSGEAHAFWQWKWDPIWGGTGGGNKSGSDSIDIDHVYVSGSNSVGGDTTPPSPPSGLSATAISATQINLSWTGSSDTGGSGLAGYKIERCTGSGCSAWAQINTSVSTTFSDTTVSASTLYSYRVRSYDNDGNNSTTYSNIAEATTTSGGDVTAPATPTGLAVTAVSPDRLFISWNANSEPDLAGYRVRRAGNVICTTTTLLYCTEDGRTANTSYTYTVSAFDASDNDSTPSSGVSQTTQTAPTETAVLTPTATTFLNIDALSYDALPFLSLYTWPINTAANAILMQFNVSGIPASSTINSAVLSLLQNTPGVGTTYTPTVHRIINVTPNLAQATGQTYDGANSWTGGATALAQSDISASITSTALGVLSANTAAWRTWTITSLIHDWVTGAQLNRGLLINADLSSAANDMREFASLNAPLSADRPFLIVTYTPTSPVEPPTGLAVTGVADLSVSLSWTASVTGGVTAYRIYRCVADNHVNPAVPCTPNVQVGSVDDLVTTFTDTRGVPFTIYTYAVKAFTSVESALSTPVNGTTTQLGLAPGYPGDVNIEAHAAVTYVERFTGTVASIVTRYNQINSQANMSVNADRPTNSPDQSMIFANPSGTTTALYKNLENDGIDEPDTLFMRYYVKYVSGPYHHSSVWLGGVNPSENFPFPRAGCLTDVRFIAAYEPVETQTFDTYLYWPSMHPDTDTSCNAGFGCTFVDPSNRCYWGNEMSGPANRPVLGSGTWRSVELMIKLNTPETSLNGELAVWLDGSKRFHGAVGIPTGAWSGASFIPGTGTPFEGFQWRNDVDLVINNLWIQNYSDGAAEMRYANLVLATSYIGPLAATNESLAPAQVQNLRVAHP